MELKGSKTEKNLMEAFAGESQARNKYTYFARIKVFILRTNIITCNPAIASIDHSRRKRIAAYFQILSGKRYDYEDMIILREKDFLGK